MNIEQLRTFYQTRIQLSETLASKTKRKIHLIGSLRLTIVLLSLLLIYLSWAETSRIIPTLLIAGLALLFLIKYHNKLHIQRDYQQTLIRIGQEELSAIDYDFSAFDGAQERMNGSHVFSPDIDLFGEKSLFQSLNRTVTSDGTNVLADWFETPLSAKKDILERQEAVRELQFLSDQRANFRAFGLLFQEKNTGSKELKDFAKEPNYLLPQKFLWKTITWLYPVFWISSIVFVSLGWWPGSVIVLEIILLFALSEIKTKKIDRIQNSLAKKVKLFSSYAELIRLIEEHNPESTALQKIKHQLRGNGQKVSSLMKELSGLLSNLDQRSSGLGRLILNTLLAWDIRYALKVEAWKEKHGEHLTEWIQYIGEYDALCSLGTFAFNHPSYIFPEVSEDYFSLEAQSLGHPMMHRNVCVRNGISIQKHPFFLIITGANMAGKSTYLRTVGVNYLLASVGASVCADFFRFYPARLVTSLRTSDSLNDNESYFFAELKRLKMIIDKLKAGEKLFIILDEILKGTNSVDKQKGSIALMKQLISMNACGIIATHDLALGELIKEFPQDISNYRFEADIRDNDLRFSYSMQPGVAENMNACFLMNKMGITVD